jgi:glycerophosphoryl diester phosphodiesterase
LTGARTLNWAHRGASGHAPQNTLAAFVLAAEMGADGIELDVHLSADGEVVVIHNHSVDATTDGQGRVSELSLAELQALDAGAWFSPRFAGQRIPTLDAVLAEVGQRLRVNIEIKGQRGRPARRHARRQARGQLEATVVEQIQAHQMVERVIVSSFFPDSLRRVRALNPDIPLGFLYAGPIHKVLPLWLYPWIAPHDALHPTFRLVDRGYVTRAQRPGNPGRGRPLNVWTVNDENDLRRMVDLGVAGIITNYPDRLAHILAQT